MKEKSLPDNVADYFVIQRGIDVTFRTGKL